MILELALLAAGAWLARKATSPPEQHDPQFQEIGFMLSKKRRAAIERLKSEHERWRDTVGMSESDRNRNPQRLAGRRPFVWIEGCWFVSSTRKRCEKPCELAEGSHCEACDDRNPIS